MKFGKLVTVKTLSIAAVAGAALLYSCQKSSESALSSTDSQNVNSESVSASTSNEAADLGNSVMTNTTSTQLATGRESGVITGLGDKDARLKGATITITIGANSTKANPSGTITIDYGTGVTTNGVTRKGKIIVTYSGKRFQPQATRNITFDGFSRNSIKLDGTYNVVVIDSTLANNGADVVITFTHTTAVTLTFGNGTTILRNATFTVVWDYVTATPMQSTITHKSGGTASGTDRKGGAYTMIITKDVVYRADCFASGYQLPISGTKTFTVTPTGSNTGTVYTVDYGTTTCDNTITVTLNAKTVTITVSSDGN